MDLQSRSSNNFTMMERTDQLPVRGSFSWDGPVMKKGEHVEDSRPRSPPTIDSKTISPPKTAELGHSTSRRMTFHGMDEIEASQTKPGTATIIRGKSSSKAPSNILQQTPTKKRRIYREESDDECGQGEQDAKLEQGEEEREEVESELVGFVKKWIDPLLDLTMDTPLKITEEMLELRMCIEKALKTDELTEGDERMLKEAIDRVKADAVKEKGISV